MNYLILCPLKKELDAFLGHLRKKEIAIEERCVGSVPLFDIPSLQITCGVGGHGKTSFFDQASMLLSQQKFRALLCLGTAGSLSAQVQVFDVVIGINTVEHDAGLEIYHGDSLLVERFKSLVPSLFTLHQGSIASGDEDIVDPHRSREIYHSTKALAVAWEGAGGAQAAKKFQTPYLEIRAITDGADHEAMKNFKKNLISAMENLADIFILESQRDNSVRHIPHTEID